MSRHFDLLRRAINEDLLVRSPSDDLPPNDDDPRHLDFIVARATVKPEEEDPNCLPSSANSPTHDRGQLDGGRIAQEKAVKHEKQDLLFNGLGNDPQSRHGGHPRWDERARDEIVKLVHRVFMFPTFGDARLVVFAGIDTGRGSSDICFYAGEVLAAQTSGSVCLVDANQRTPLLHHLLGIGTSPGLTEALANPDPIKDFAVPITGGNLWLVPPGAPVLDAPGLFTSDRFCSRMTELREEFDYVLIDAPPVSSCTDALLLGQKSDGVILIVEANSTRRETARAARAAFQAVNVKLLGAILNNRTFPVPEALYKKF